MKKREMIAWGIALLSWAICASYYYVQKGRAETAEVEMSDLRSSQKSLAEKAEYLQTLNDALALDRQQLNADLADANSVIAELKARKTPREVVKWRSMPGDCRACMENNSLPVTVTDDKEWVRTHVRDAFHPEDGASVELLPGFDTDVLAPSRSLHKQCNTALGDCIKNLDEATAPKPPKPEPPITFETEQGIWLGTGYMPSGDLGINGEYAGRFMRMGSRDGLHAEFGVNAGAFTRFDGTNVEPYIVGGFEVKW